MKKLDILNQTVKAARGAIPTEINPEEKQQKTDMDKLLQDEDLILARDAERRRDKMAAMNKVIQEAAFPEPETETMTRQKILPEQLPVPPIKQKRELKKNTPATDSIDIGITLDLSRLQQLVEELKSATTAVYIPYSIDVKLTYLSKYLRHKYNLSRQGGISNKALACFILENVLKNIKYEN